MTLRIPALVCVAAILSGGCVEMRHGRPIVGGSVVPDPTGTIAGHVQTTGGTPLEGRKVTAIGVATGGRFDAVTSSTGGYTLQVPRGRYRLEVELRSDERLAQRAPETTITLGDVDEGMDFFITR